MSLCHNVYVTNLLKLLSRKTSVRLIKFPKLLSNSVLFLRTKSPQLNTVSCMQHGKFLEHYFPHTPSGHKLNLNRDMQLLNNANSAGCVSLSTAMTLAINQSDCKFGSAVC